MSDRKKKIIVFSEIRHTKELESLLNAYGYLELYNLNIKQYDNKFNALVNFHIIIFFIVDLNKKISASIRKTSANFSSIPKLAIIKSQKHILDTARYCGELGIQAVMPFDDIDNLDIKIESITNESPCNITLERLGIFKESYPYKMRKALEIIECDYVMLLSNTEICEIMNVNDKFLAKLFSKNEFMHPKKLLLLLKVFHSVLLMPNTGYNLFEIARLSGFTNQKRYCEGFQRIFSQSPGSFRNEIMYSEIYEIENILISTTKKHFNYSIQST